MCGIAGFYQTKFNYTEDPKWLQRLYAMKESLLHRGPDDNHIWLSSHAGLAHTRLSIIDVSGGKQPMIKRGFGKACTLVYNGELYNTKELKVLLKPFDLAWETTSDTEYIINGYLAFGISFIQQLNGIFAFALYDGSTDELFLGRDQLGVKPLFYQMTQESFVFGSEPKALFSYGIAPKLNQESWGEIFGLGPARTPGHGVFKDMKEVLPGHVLRISAPTRKPMSLDMPFNSIENSPNHLQIEDATYWELVGRVHTDSYEATVKKVSHLVQDSIIRQMISDVPICTFLSGGLDSSLVSAICSRELKKQGKQLDTFSFDFAGNKENFKSNSFQSSLDRPFVDIMVEHIDSHHTYLECTNQIQADYLYDAVDARDLPCMSDVESSLLYFCSQVATSNRVALTGESADEIFGGYPWFHREDLLKQDHFPWSYDMRPRTALLRSDFLREIHLEEYAKAAYDASIAQTPMPSEENDKQTLSNKLEFDFKRRRREVSWLNVRWFMATLLNRMDRTSMYSGLEARVPFADYRILEYVFNIPWEMKCYNNVTKSLLIETGKDLLPHTILYRKKSPYPKTYDKGYERLLGDRLKAEIYKSSAPLLEIVDKKKVMQFLESPKDYGKPWYGQLMAGPQMIAYLLQISYWIKKFDLV
ncbi:asparagine synthase (glutamine-hydrolyzing) [Lachnospiraceae bacterium ZAX-1]